MKLFKDFLLEVQKYSSAATSIKGKEVAALVKLFSKGFFKPNGTALDYGAGKYGRNAEYLRAQGIRTFAYDKFNGSGVDGWEGVSSTLPTGATFDTGFTSYVLNVVPVSIEAEIINDLESRVSGKVFHITRGTDITQTILRVITGKSRNSHMMDFIESEYPEIFAKISAGDANKDLANELAYLGVVTAKDSFQRIPDLSRYGYTKSGSGSSLVWTK
jgi:hypothetical protein